VLQEYLGPLTGLEDIGEESLDIMLRELEEGLCDIPVESLANDNQSGKLILLNVFTSFIKV